jgi:uncharacterized protein (TIGR03083 family)
VIRVALSDEYRCSKTESTPLTTPDIPPEIGAQLASLSEQPPSIDIGDVMRAALVARAAIPMDPPPSGDEVAAFGRAVDDVRRTLALLTTAHWSLPAVNGLNVGELVGHLIGTQVTMAAELGLRGAVAGAEDHIESTREWIRAARALTPSIGVEEFARHSRVITTHLATLDSDGLAAPARFGPIQADIRFVLVGRVFELWTHDNDLRTAAGLPRVEPDRERLWMMTRTVMPFVRIIGDPRVRIVLTGPGGGVWAAEGDEVAEVVADASKFCRRIANRLDADAIEADISGDVDTAIGTLTAIAGLALD